jgi:TatA/E family protein of Tat protein translocase
MGQLGFSEMLVIFVVALLVFGPKKLPELGKSLGKGIREFRKATNELKSTWEEQVKDIQAPLNDVKRDINTVGQDLKSDIYKHLEEPTPAPAALPAASIPSSHEVPPAPQATESTVPATESTVPKEHV